MTGTLEGEAIRNRIQAMVAAGVSLLVAAQAERAGNSTALQSAPVLYEFYPQTSANDMAAVLVEVWGCQLSGTDLASALGSCLTKGGGAAYTSGQIASAVPFAMSLVFWDVALLPTQYGGAVNYQLKVIGLSQGNLAGVTAAEGAQFLIISALPGDYTPTPGSLIAAIQDAYGVSVATMAQSPAADYRGTHACWISKPFADFKPAKPVPYTQLICFESQGPNAAAAIPGIFAGLKESLPKPPAIPDTGLTIASALLSTGSAGADPAQVLTALFTGCRNLMTAGDGYNITSFRIDVYKAELQSRMVALFNRLKSNGRTTTTIRFDQNFPGDGATFAVYTESGLHFSNNIGNFWMGSHLQINGFVGTGVYPSTVTVTPNPGEIFDFKSLQVCNIRSGVPAQTTVFIGIKADGTTVTAKFTTPEKDTTPQTFAPAGFESLVSLSIDLILVAFHNLVFVGPRWVGEN
jgi:hypothetical protein